MRRQQLTEAQIVTLFEHLRARGVSILDDLLAHVAPLGWEHIALTGDYIWNDSNPATGFRPLRDVRGAFLPQAA